MEITLNKDGWHGRIQKFTFGEQIAFDHLCPYFWLTVAAMLLAPFMAIANVAAFVVSPVVNWMSKFQKTRQAEKLEDLVARLVADPVAAYLQYRNGPYVTELFNKLVDSFPTFTEYEDHINLGYKLYWAEKSKQTIARAARTQKLQDNPLYKFGTVLAQYAGFTISTVLLAVAVYLFSWLVMEFILLDVTIKLVFLIAALILAVLIGVGWTLLWLGGIFLDKYGDTEVKLVPDSVSTFFQVMKIMIFENWCPRLNLK